MSRHIWLPLTQPYQASVARAESQLLRQLGRAGDSPIIRQLSRRMSQALSKRLVHTRITPNQMTLLSASIGICGAVLLVLPSYLTQLLGSLLFLLSTVVDGCDGEIARLTFQESSFGAKLDVVMDNVVHLFLFPAIALGAYYQQQDSYYLALGAVALGGVFFSMVVYLPYVLQRRPMQTMQTIQTRLHESLASRDFAYLLPLAVLFGRLHWFLWIVTVGTYLFATAWIAVSLWLRWRPQPGFPESALIQRAGAKR